MQMFLKRKIKESKGDRSVQRFTGTIVTLWRCWVYAIHSRIQNKIKKWLVVRTVGLNEVFFRIAEIKD